MYRASPMGPYRSNAKLYGLTMACWQAPEHTACRPRPPFDLRRQSTRSQSCSLRLHHEDSRALIQASCNHTAVNEKVPSVNRPI